MKKLNKQQLNHVSGAGERMSQEEIRRRFKPLVDHIHGRTSQRSRGVSGLMTWDDVEKEMAAREQREKDIMRIGNGLVDACKSGVLSGGGNPVKTYVGILENTLVLCAKEAYILNQRNKR